MTREEAVRRIDQAAEEKLTELDLSGLGLEELSREIVNCTHLTRLDLRKNKITSIPEWFTQLPKLESLNLNNNQITSIPEVLGQLSNLESLHLACNPITYISEALGQLSKLAFLDLLGNRITYIPEAVGQLSRLRILFLSVNQITSIPEALGQLSSLETLFLSNNKITSIPEAIGQLSNLKELLLANNQITEIPEAIRSMKNLEKLDLRGNLVPIPSPLLGYGQDYEGCGDLRTILNYYFHSRIPALPKLNVECQRIEPEGYFDAETPQDARRWKTASIVPRQGQPEFRRKLLTAYGGRCPITDCDVESAIEAAHIISYHGIPSNHVTNGLPLRADIHTLFDLHLLSIRPDTKKVVIAPELVGTCYQYLADRKLTLPQDQKTAPNQNALSKHYETFLSKCKSSQLQRL